MKNGGASRDRTADLYNAIVALSQLSYGPTVPLPRKQDKRTRDVTDAAAESQ